MGGFDLAMANEPITAVNIHHVIQQYVILKNDFFQAAGITVPVYCHR
jgi:hypothetical protein